MQKSRHPHRRKANVFPTVVEICEPRTLLTSPAMVVDEISSIDGAGNNLEHPDWGSTNIPLLRRADADYADGLSDPSGTDRPSAREISNGIAAAEGSTPNERYLTDILWLWGQFVDHDLDLTEPVFPNQPMNVAVPQWDPYFDPFGDGDRTIDLNRSFYTIDEDGVRQQMNQITAFHDGSMVYGSDPVRAAALRAFAGGKLKTSDGDLLPFNSPGLPNAGGNFDFLFLAGDVRANENVALSSMHTLWVREHNRIAQEIADGDPSLSDEEIFQQARALVRAELQAITYNEFLPALLGRHALSEYTGYDPEVNPGISTEFSTAAYRLGHSLLSSTLQRLDENGQVIADGNLSLRDAFFNPGEVQDNGIDSILRGLSNHLAQELDNQIVDDVRNFLFGPPGAGGFDLASLNIQRGRDHGLSSYNDTREALGLGRVNDFSDISSNAEVVGKLAALYDSVDDIDLWVGGLAEDHLPGSSVGETFNSILVDQFERLRDGDRFWYQNVFEGQKLRELESTTLADVIERNTGIRGLQQNVFFAPQVLIVDLAEHAATDVTVRATHGMLFVVNDENGAIIASRPLDQVDRVMLIGSNQEAERITVKFISPEDLPGGIVVDAGRSEGDVLRIIETNKKDEILVDPYQISFNGTMIEFLGVGQIDLHIRRDKDTLEISDELAIPVVVAAYKTPVDPGHHDDHHEPAPIQNQELALSTPGGHKSQAGLMEELFGSQDFLDTMLGTPRGR